VRVPGVMRAREQVSIFGCRGFSKSVYRETTRVSSAGHFVARLVGRSRNINHALLLAWIDARISTKLHRAAGNSDASTRGRAEFTMGVDRERRY
jgi:hypothetical protein